MQILPLIGVTYTTSTFATFIDRSLLHDPKSFQTASKLLHAGHHGAKLENVTLIRNI